MQHIVKKQVIEVRLTSRQNAFQIQNEVSNFYWKKIIPEMEKIFDQMSGGVDILSIDKLEIELGILQVEQLLSAQPLSEICPGLISRIREKISVELRKTVPDQPLSITSQWMFYMEKGYLNWNTFRPDASWDNQVLEALATNYTSIMALRRLVSSNRSALHRIASRHDDLFLTRLTEVLTAEKQAKLFSLVRDLMKILQHCQKKIKNLSDSDIKVIRQKIWKRTIENAAKGKWNDFDERWTADKLAEPIISWLIQAGSETHWLNLALSTESQTFCELITATFEKNDKGTLIKPTATGRDRFQSLREPMNNNDDTNRISKEVRGNSAWEKSESTLSAESVVRNRLKTITRKEADLDVNIASDKLDDEIFVVNAGIVLLHPFISSLFSRLSLTHEGKFMDELFRQKAIYVLHYLTTGRDEAEEFELLIPKLLTGYSLEETITMPVILESNEKEEAFNLLEVAIEKWKILGSTSAAAFQESFLQRGGKLFFKDQAFHLQIEQGPFDMLIDHLPWNLSIMKLPWMKFMLKVEWR